MQPIKYQLSPTFLLGEHFSVPHFEKGGGQKKMNVWGHLKELLPQSRALVQKDFVK